MQELRGSNPRLDISLCPHISSQLVEGGGPPEEGVGRWYLVSSGHFWMKVAKTNLRERGSFFFFFLREWGSLGSDTAMDLRPDSYQDSILTLCPLRTSASFLLIAVAFPTRQEVWLLT